MNRRTTLLLLPSILLTLLFGPAAARAALGDHQWSNGYAAYGSSDVDGAGNIVSGGSFNGSVSLGGPTLVAGPTGDVYLAKHDTNGQHVWSLQFTPTEGYVSLDHVAVDGPGNIFIVGTLTGFLGKVDAREKGARVSGTIDFGGGPISAENETYVAAFDPSGNHLFSRTVGRGFPRDAAAGGGYCAVTGYAYDTMDFGGGPLTYVGGADAFVAYFSFSGGHVWSSFFGDGAGQGGMAVDIDDAGDMVLVVNSESAIDLGGGNLTPTVVTGLCVARYDTAGAHEWSIINQGRFTSGAGILTSCDVAIKGDGTKVAMTGQMNGTCDFGGGSLTSNGSGDAYVVSWDGNGSHQWSDNYGGSITDKGEGIAIDSNGNIFVAGTFSSTGFTLGGASFSPNVAFQDYFLGLLDPMGVHLWSAPFGNTYQGLIDAHVDAQNNLVISGFASAGIDFGGGSLSTANLFHAEFEGNGGGGGPTAVGPMLRTAVLEPNVPNPFNPATTIRFELDYAAATELSVYDVQGRRVSTLVRGELPAGQHAQTWRGLDDSGRRVASGTYFYRLKHDGQVQTRKMVLTK